MQTGISAIFAVAKAESEESYSRLMKSVHDAFLKRFGNSNILEKTKYVYSDWSKGIKAAVKSILPHARHFRCLQYAKKNVSQNSKNFKNKTNLCKNVQDIQRCMHFTAFLPGRLLLPFIWKYVLGKMYKAEEKELAEYMLNRTLEDDNPK